MRPYRPAGATCSYFLICLAFICIVNAPGAASYAIPPSSIATTPNDDDRYSRGSVVQSSQQPIEPAPRIPLTSDDGFSATLSRRVLSGSNAPSSFGDVDVFYPESDALYSTGDALAPTAGTLTSTADTLTTTADTFTSTADTLTPIVDNLTPSANTLTPIVDTLSPTANDLPSAGDSPFSTENSLFSIEDNPLPAADSPLSTADTLSSTTDTPLSTADTHSLPEDHLSSSLDSVAPISSPASSVKNDYLVAQGYDEPRCEGVVLCCTGLRMLDGVLVENCEYCA